MKINPVTGQVLSGPLEPVYVYEAPVRLWHWVMVVAMIFLAGTGYLIGSPPPAIGGEAAFSYFFGYIRMIHFIAAMVFIVMFLVRVYWAFAGNHHARSIFVPPVWNGSWWRGLFGQMKYYLFMQRESDLWTGHNPLAQIAMFSMYTLGAIFIIVTGLALYSEQWGWGTAWMNAFGWVFVLFGDPQQVRTLHHLAMWWLLLFSLIHVYMVFCEDIMSGETVIGTMISGIRFWKNEPRA
ncbi:MAG: Ni/Fe-hydrogenase, b-type cytochrome subunit [Casimicrobiaceae bacterium]